MPTTTATTQTKAHMKGGGDDLSQALWILGVGLIVFLFVYVYVKQWVAKQED